MSPGRGFVWIVIGRRGPTHERYVIAVCGQATGAEALAQRFRRQHPLGDVAVERYTVLNGQERTES